MSKIEIKDLYLVFGNEKQKALKMLKEGKTKSEILKATGCTVAVKDANLSINEGEIFVIMGLSGSGKSTLLRCINRLIRPTSGEVIINGTDIAKVSDKELLQIRRKELAMVFQNFGLLPHRSVLHNIAFGLELQGVKKGEREQKAMESMQLVGLKGYENQMVSELSGGMQQRVGLARALANNPEVLLMDEAFSALDPLIRVQMQDELLTLQSKMKKTIVFITHDLSEAIKLGDRIAIMKDGEIVQIGTSEEILTEPANAYVERFVENVDRSKIITASSVMVDKPIVARLKKEGPEVLIRKMRERNLTVLPVVDSNNLLVGEVRLNDLLKLRKEQIRSIESVVRHEVHSVLGDTVLEASFFDALSMGIGGFIDGFQHVLFGIPFYITIAVLAALAWFKSGKGTAVFTLLGLLLIYGMGFWEETMQTLALVLSSTCLALLLGVPLGIWTANSDRCNKIMRPVLDFMQTMPAFVYLIPAVLFFGLGTVPGAFATIIFAMPPVVRLTGLGIRQVPKNVVEASRSFGATPWQLLYKVQLPLALPTILTGINQTIMMSLSMVVIAAMISAGGLGEIVLKGITQMKIGLGFEGGIAVVILAIVLDRITQGMADNRKSKKK